METELWLSLSEVAELVGVHPSTIRIWADQGRLPVHRTQGGHRRFKRSEVELCMSAQRINSTADLNSIIQNALKRVRLQVGEGALEAEEWYGKLDMEARQQYRESGRALLQGLINCLISEEDDNRSEARALGYEYASRGQRCGLSCADASHAFLFFRTQLVEAMLGVYESAAIRSSDIWSDMFRKTTAFTDQILITLLETYEAYRRNGR